MKTNDNENLTALFKELEARLLNDEKPSAFLKSLAESGRLGAYPFSMLFDLRAAQQSPQHHPEGSVWNHTMLVIDEAAKRRRESRDKRAFMWAALLHDIGKPSTSVVRNGRITSYDHDIAGARLSREFLEFFGEPEDFVERVSNLVRYHMQILFVARGLHKEDLNGIRENSDADEIALLGLCDRLGRKNPDEAAERENIRLFLKKYKDFENKNV